MKLLSLVICIISALIFTAGHFAWGGYAIYEIFFNDMPFWSTVLWCFIGWAITSAVTLFLAITCAAFAELNKPTKKNNWN